MRELAGMDRMAVPETMFVNGNAAALLLLLAVVSLEVRSWSGRRTVMYALD